MDVTETIREPRAGEREHLVQFYERDDFLLSTLRDFIGAGLRSGEVGIVLATREHLAGLAERLQADGLDVTALTDSRQYVPLDAAELLNAIMRDGAPQPDRFAAIVGEIVARAAEGERRVRIFGELVALLWAEEKYAGALALENLWNELRQTHSFTLLCGYPLSSFGGEALAEPLSEVCAEHSRVIPAESYTALPSPEERLRAIALLQQKAGSLQAEIAERKRVEDALERTLRLQEESLSAIAHDLRTPLAVLHGQVQLLRRRAARGGLDEETILQGLEQIEGKSRNMAQLINELVAVARQSAAEEQPPDKSAPSMNGRRG
jgi:signal transduction histidine kinase